MVKGRKKANQFIGDQVIPNTADLADLYMARMLEGFRKFSTGGIRGTGDGYYTLWKQGQRLPITLCTNGQGIMRNP